MFFWSRSKILFCLNWSNLRSYLFTFSVFTSILCFSSSITVFNPFLLILFFSYSSFIFCFFCDPKFLFKSLVNKFTSYRNFFISPSVMRVHQGLFLSYSLFSSILSVLLPTKWQLLKADSRQGTDWSYNDKVIRHNLSLRKCWNHYNS